MDFPPKQVTPTNYHHHGDVSASNTISLLQPCSYISRKGECALSAVGMVYGECKNENTAPVTKNLFSSKIIITWTVASSPCLSSFPLPPYTLPLSHQSSLPSWPPSDLGAGPWRFLTAHCSFKQPSEVSLIKIDFVIIFSKAAPSSMAHSFQERADFPSLVFFLHFFPVWGWLSILLW